MMHQEVCIVLNERESTKAKAAEALEARLTEYNITSSRITVSANINKIVFEKKPRILVLDYLLGDYSTGLDIIALFGKLPLEKRPVTFFLTDEPSVQVAVDAMRLGARNYFELDNPESVNLLAREIKSESQSRKYIHAPVKTEVLALEDLVASAPSSVALITRARSLLSKNAPLIVIQGKPGSGISTLAQALEATHRSTLATLTVDLRTFDSPASSLLHNPNSRLAALGNGLWLTVEHADQDDGEFINFIAKHLKSIWPGQSKQSSFVCVCTVDKTTAHAWQRIGAELIELPSLDARREDISPLIQRFSREATRLSEAKIKPFTTDTVRALVAREWPGQIRQLRNVVINSSLASTFDQTDLDSLVETEYQASALDLGNSVAADLDPLTCAYALAASNHSYRQAAVRLGCNLRDLIGTLRQSHD